MIDPSKGDGTFPQTYVVLAQNESEAFRKADALKEQEEKSISLRSVFSQNIQELMDSTN